MTTCHPPSVTGTEQPRLGLATTRQLLDELRARFEMHCDQGLDYTSVGSFFGDAEPEPAPPNFGLEPAPAISVGAHVRLNSGGPEMIVVSLGTGEAGAEAMCEWDPGRSSVFPLACLLLIPAAAETPA